ncbi:hypothetical protein GCM10017600_35980 [Streptosporangium carneum]|uniref:Uncharacterized protein n=1 Tax=Streptosporangium carneum TaxID=47481 RepID=A0A9W6I1X3_9ACTN|nr:hypothetical protein GCM10017600_35980 [Streptosporangium carneum]
MGSPPLLVHGHPVGRPPTFTGPCPLVSADRLRVTTRRTGADEGSESSRPRQRPTVTPASSQAPGEGQEAAEKPVPEQNQPVPG